ncbi:MAG: nucleoside permease [Lewinella sp.]|nr:nucleoside permease [Lewinella sp.]
MQLAPRLSILMFFQFFVWGTWLITLGTYLLENLHFSGRQVGLIYATNAIAATVSPPVVGLLADKLFSANRLLVILHILGGCCLLCAYQSHSFGWFFASMLGYNLCYVPTFSLSTALCFHHLPDPNRQYPPIRVWGTIAWIFTSVIISVLALEAQATPLLIGGLTSILFGIHNLNLPATPPQPGLNWADLKGEEVQRLLRDRSLIVLIVCEVLICIPAAFYYSFVNPFLNEVGMDYAAAKMALGQLVEIGIVLAMPWFFRNLRLRSILFWGMAVWGLRYFAFALGRPGEWTEFLLYLAIAVQGFAFAWVSLAAQLYVNSRVPAYLRATAQGLVTFASFGLGSFIGSTLAGEVVRHFTEPTGSHEWQYIFLVPAIIGCLVAFGFWRYFPPATQS